VGVFTRLANRVSKDARDARRDAASPK